MSKWGADDAYKRHETGDLDFAGYCAHLSERLGITLPPHEWLEGWNAIFVAPYPGVVARLPRIAERFDLCCYSNTNDAHHAEWSTRYADELKAFRRVYVSSAIRRRKPDVESFRWVARDMGHAPEHILFIDDTLENIEGARAAGFMAVHARGDEAVSRALDEVFRC